MCRDVHTHLLCTPTVNWPPSSICTPLLPSHKGLSRTNTHDHTRFSPPYSAPAPTLPHTPTLSHSPTLPHTPTLPHSPTLSNTLPLSPTLSHTPTHFHRSPVSDPPPPPPKSPVDALPYILHGTEGASTVRLHILNWFIRGRVERGKMGARVLCL